MRCSGWLAARATVTEINVAMQPRNKFLKREQRKSPLINRKPGWPSGRGLMASATPEFKGNLLKFGRQVNKTWLSFKNYFVSIHHSIARRARLQRLWPQFKPRCEKRLRRFASRLQHCRLYISPPLALPRKWRFLIIDFEWDIKDPLRTTSSLAVTSLSVPVSAYILHNYTSMQGAVARCLCPATLDWEVLGMGVGCRDVVLCAWSLHLQCTCTLSAQEWNLVGQRWLVCLNSFIIVMAAGAVCSPGRWAGTRANRFHSQGNCCKNNY